MRARQVVSWMVARADHVFVYATLLGWWIVGPAFFDDGWIVAVVENPGPGEEFGSYYDNLNVTSPQGLVWLSLLRVVRSLTSDLLWLRLPSVVLGLVAWHLSHSVFDRVLRQEREEASLLARAALAGAFALGWISWNVNLRSEASIAALGALSLWAIYRFLRDGRESCLIVAVGAAVIAVSIHPEGVVVVAALIVAAPRVLSWLVADALRAVRVLSVGLGGAALLLLLLWGPVGVDGWFESVNSFAQQVDHSLTWRDEGERYSELLSAGNAHRRLAVFVPMLGLAFRAMNRDRKKLRYGALPVACFLLALVALAFTPSKWMWHFGALVPFGALALGIEVDRWLAVPAERPKVWRTLVAGTLVLAVMYVGWRGGTDWHTPLSILSERLYRAANRLLSAFAYPGWWLGGLLVAALVSARRKTRLEGDSAPSVSGRWVAQMHDAAVTLVPVALALSIAIAGGTLAVDGFIANSGWTLPRQNLSSLAGQTCGLADHLRVQVPEVRLLPARNASLSSVEQDFEPRDGVSRHEFRTIPDDATAPDADGAADFIWTSEGMSAKVAWFASPWFPVAALSNAERSTLEIDLGGALATNQDVISVESVERTGTGGHLELGTTPVTNPPGSSTPATVRIGALIHQRATHIRIVAVDTSADPDGWISFSSPVIPGGEMSFSDLASRTGKPVLFAPQLRTLFPCLPQPRLMHGSVPELPGLIVDAYGWPLVLRTSPLHHLPDAADLLPLPLLWTGSRELPVTVLLVRLPDS